MASAATRKVCQVWGLGCEVQLGHVLAVGLEASRFLIHQTGHREVPVAQGEVPMGGMVCGEGWAHNRC